MGLILAFDETMWYLTSMQVWFLMRSKSLFQLPTTRVPNRFSGIRDFPSLKLGIRNFKAKSGRDSGLKVCAGGGMPKIALGITGLLEILDRDYGIEEPY